MKESVLEKGVTVIAMEHYTHRTKKRCFRNWCLKARKTKEALLRMIALMKKKPLSMIVLMKFIGFHTMPREQQGKFDLLDFHSYCTLKNKYRPKGEMFSQNIGQALKARLRQIVKAWKV